MTPVDHLKGILSISACVWLLFSIYVILSVKKFIVKRYERETALGQTVFFTQHMPFAKYLPDYFSVSLYSSHLLSFVWGWKFIKFVKEKRPKVTYFTDIDSPEIVTRHFSAKEIRRVKLMTISLLIVFLHGAAYYIFRAIWPEVFN